MTKLGWFKIIFSLVLFVVIVLVCVGEDQLVKSSLSRVKNCCYEIESAIEQNGGIVNGEVASLVDNMQYYWSKDEDNLCYVVNHRSIEGLGMEIVRLKTYIDEEEPIEFYVSLNIIKNYVETFQNFMGAGLGNVI